jgi:ferredoxin
MILFFSGTGNSEHVAEKLAQLLDDRLLSIGERIWEKNLSPVYSDRPLVFVVPTYAWRMPRLVEQWVRRVTFSGCQNAYFVMTCGDSIGDAGHFLKQLCKEKNFRYMGVQQILMPENYIAMFQAPEEPEAIAIVMRAEPVIKKTTSIIKSGLPIPAPKTSLVSKLLSRPVNAFFYLFLVKDKKFYVTEQCVGCGKCTRVCPLHNVELVDDHPVWKHKCTHCMACITGCPVRAIEYGTVSEGQWRYHCPEETWKH